MEVAAVIFTSLLGSGGLIGVASYAIKRYIDKRMEKEAEENRRRQEAKTRRMAVDDKLHHAYGRCLFWMQYHITKGVPPNGELNAAFQELQEAEEEKKQLDREIISWQEED